MLRDPTSERVDTDLQRQLAGREADEREDGGEKRSQERPRDCTGNLPEHARMVRHAVVAEKSRAADSGTFSKDD